MRRYKIFLIEEEFASHYFGRETIIYRLFLEFEKTKKVEKEIIKKQIEYVTKPLPSLRIHQLLETTLTNDHRYKRIQNSHIIKIEERNVKATLTVLDRYLLLESNGSFEAEAVFFEILRKYDSRFLAMEFESDRYGWLNPKKERKFI